MTKHTFSFLLGLSGVVAALAWFIYLSPRAYDIDFIQSDMKTVSNAPSTVNNRYAPEGPFWLSFTTPARHFTLDSLILRTKSCTQSLTTSKSDWHLPENGDLLCDNQKGIILRNTAKYLKTETHWHIAGSTQGDAHGVVLDKNWAEPKLIGGMIFLLFGFSLLLYLKISAKDVLEKTTILFFLLAALLLRFWFVFILQPPEMGIFSDMEAYFQRATEIDRGFYDIEQLFQPIGFTLWSLFVRKLGGFELFNWAQVLLSWGIVLLTFLIARDRFGRLAGVFSLFFAAIHIPQTAMASLHLAENFYGFLITLFLWTTLKAFKNESLKNYFAMGLLLGLAFYFKGSHSFFIPVLMLWLLYRNRSAFRAAVMKTSVLAIGSLLIVFTHMSWTKLHYGKAYPGPTAGALNFVEGKCPSKNNQDSTGNQWMSPLFVITGETVFKQWPRPFTDQAYFWKEGLKCIQEEPIVLLTSLRYIYYLFWGNTLWPVGATDLRDLYLDWENLFHFVLLPLTALGALAYSRRKDGYSEVSSLMMVSLFFTVWFFKSENRLRVPFDTIVIVWAAAGSAWLIERAKALRKFFVFREEEIVS